MAIFQLVVERQCKTNVSLIVPTIAQETLINFGERKNEHCSYDTFFAWAFHSGLEYRQLNARMKHDCKLTYL